MAQEAGGNEMESVKNYFNTAGFERWNKIYGTTEARSATRRATRMRRAARHLPRSARIGRLPAPARRCACGVAALTRRPPAAHAAQEVNKVQLDIRTGHAQTVDKVLGWLQSEGSLEDITVCDVRQWPRFCARAAR